MLASIGRKEILVRLEKGRRVSRLGIGLRIWILLPVIASTRTIIQIGAVRRHIRRVAHVIAVHGELLEDSNCLGLS